MPTKRERTKVAPSNFDPTDHAEDGAMQFDRFRELATRILQVPKKEIDELAEERKENDERFAPRAITPRRRTRPIR